MKLYHLRSSFIIKLPKKTLQNFSRKPCDIQVGLPILHREGRADLIITRQPPSKGYLKDMLVRHV